MKFQSSGKAAAAQLGHCLSSVLYFIFQTKMDDKGKWKSESDGEERLNFQPKQYTRNLQRIFHQESNFKFRALGSYDEDKELLSPAESEPDDMTGDEQMDEPEAVHRRVLGGDPGGGSWEDLQPPGRGASDNFIFVDSELQNQAVVPKRSFQLKKVFGPGYKVCSDDYDKII